MKNEIFDFDFDQSVENDINLSRAHVKELGLEVGNNVFLLCDSLEKTKKLNGCFLECGVFKGSTILTAKKFCLIRNIERKFYGADSFEGFAESQTKNEYDHPSKFQELYNQGKISKQHLECSQQRIDTLDKNAHLSKKYFSNPGKLIFEQADLNGITLIKGNFRETLKNFDEPIAVLHLDCDLYEPYLECLELLFKNVVPNGIIVLDEYYSHKYPGARIAVDQFLSKLSNEKYKLLKFNTGTFERWCIVKN